MTQKHRMGHMRRRHRMHYKANTSKSTGKSETGLSGNPFNIRTKTLILDK